MGTKKRQMKVYEVSYECDKCHNGEMLVVELEGGAKIFKGHKVQHACNNCGHKMYFHKEHPFVCYV
jgi:RNase P subunit RPR2